MIATIAWWVMRIAIVLFVLYGIHTVYIIGREEVRILLGKQEDKEQQ